MDIENRVIVVTGGLEGIDFQADENFLRKQAKFVAIFDRVDSELANDQRDQTRCRQLYANDEIFSRGDWSKYGLIMLWNNCKSIHNQRKANSPLSGTYKKPGSFESFPMQAPESVAAAMSLIRNGQCGDVWVSTNDQPPYSVRDVDDHKSLKIKDYSA